MTDQAIELVELLNPRTQKEAPDIPINTENYACDVEDEVNNGEEIVENEDKPKSPWRQIIKPVKPCDDSQTYELFPLWRIPLYTGQATERVEVANQPTQKEVPLWRYSVPKMRPGFPKNFKFMGFYPLMSVARFLLVIDFVLDVATAGTSQN